MHTLLTPLYFTPFKDPVLALLIIGYFLTVFAIAYCLAWLFDLVFYGPDPDYRQPRNGGPRP